MTKLTNFPGYPHRTREVLRRRFARRLPPSLEQVRLPPEDPTLSDELMLELLRTAETQHRFDLDWFRDAYESQTGGPAIPDLQTLLDEGWIHLAGRRVFVPSPLRRALLDTTDPRFQPLSEVLRTPSETTVTFADSARKDVLLAPHIARIQTPGDFHGLTCPRPSWVAARLWELSRADGATPERLATWLDRWDLLQAWGLVARPIPRQVWAREDRLEFWNVAVTMLCDASTLVDWPGAHTLFVRATTPPGGVSSAGIHDLPVTLVERLRWLETYPQEGLAFECFAHPALGDLAGLLFDDLAEAENLGPIEGLTGRLLERVAQTPELLWRLLRAVDNRPVLLADLASHPNLAAAAALHIAQKRAPNRASAEEIDLVEDVRGRGEAFHDALTLTVARVTAGEEPTELAVLLDEVFQMASTPRSDEVVRTQPLLAAIKGAIAGLELPALEPMLQALVSRLPKERFPVTKLAPILELLDLGVVPTDAVADVIVDYYAKAIGPESLVPSVVGVSPSACRALWDLAAMNPQRLIRFNAPTEGRAYLAMVKETQDNEYSAARRVAEALRIHIRVLARAAQANREIPAPLIASLIQTVGNAARADWKRGRVAGFAPELEHSPVGSPDDQPLAQDLAGALSVLGQAATDDLIEAILETDEPTILAEIASRVSAESRVPIVKRLGKLKPEDAADISFLTSAQARVNALLTAGLGEVASQYMAVEKTLNPVGKVAGRALATFYAELRLAFSQHDWDHLRTVEPPKDLNAIDGKAANDSLWFYRGLTAYAQADGVDMAHAEAIFSRLWRENPHVIAYGVNLMATRASQLLAADIFVRLTGERLRKARAILQESEAIVGGGADNQRVLGQNRALLLLATGAPQAALEALAQLGSDRPSPRDAAFRAVAFNRLSDGRQALAILDAANTQFGTDEILLAARRHILEGAPHGDVASTVLTDDQMASIRSAMTALRALDPNRQAGAMGHAASVDHLVLDQLLQVAGSLILLAPEMSKLGMDWEDNISGVVRELLSARVHFLGWSAPDQPRGGRTAKRNAGERDIVLRRDATEVAVIEAVACRAPPHTDTVRKDLAQHFQKLFAYSPCGLYVHLTYGLIDNPETILPVLQGIAQNDAPSGYSFKHFEPLRAVGGPSGFTASYTHPGGEAKMIFIVVDLKQEALVAAATLAENTKATKSSAGKQI